MVEGCGATISKMILFVLNALVWVVSIALIALGGYVLANQDKYSGAFGSGTNTLAVVCGVVIGVGCLIFLTAFSGCCGAIKESSCLLKLYIFIMVVLVLLEVIGGIVALVFRGNIESSLRTSMTDQVKKYYGETDQTVVTEFMDGLQRDGKCCGVSNYTDYEGSKFAMATGQLAPKSCCTDSEVADCNTNAANLFKIGCLQSLVNFFKDNFLYIGAAALALVGFEIFASIFACCVISGINKGEYE